MTSKLVLVAFVAIAALKAVLDVSGVSVPDVIHWRSEGWEATR